MKPSARVEAVVPQIVPQQQITSAAGTQYHILTEFKMKPEFSCKRIQNVMNKIMLIA